MSARERRLVETPTATVALREWGAGEPALTIHGALLNGTQYEPIAELVASERRRLIAPDLMGHGHTRMALDQELGMDAQAEVLRELLDALALERVDLVGSDSGGGVAQVFAVAHPERVRSLALTNCDVYDNNPPKAFRGFVRELRRRGTRRLLLDMLADPDMTRSDEYFGTSVEDASRLTDDLLREYLEPLCDSDESAAAFERYLYANDGRHTIAIADALRELHVPATIVWGEADPYFAVEWAHWLHERLPDVRRLVLLKRARLYMHHDRPRELAAILEAHWAEAAVSG